MNLTLFDQTSFTLPSDYSSGPAHSYLLQILPSYNSTTYAYVLRYNAVLIGIQRYQHFGTCSLDMQSSLHSWATLNIETARSSKTSALIHISAGHHILDEPIFTSVTVLT
jgi:hypothetical protein